LGLHDLPAEQRRDLYAYDLAAGGHLIVAGGARSGRTSALRTLAAGLSRLPVDRAHLYALDCAGGGLACLSALPHCGAVVPRADTALGTRLLIRLDAELTRRQAATSVERPPPWLVLLVDSWEGFAQAYDGVDQGRPAELLLRLVREGGAAGIRVVLTGDRALLTARIAALVGERLVLRMADPDSYPLAGIPPGSVPAWMPPGRALARGDTVTEVQVALLDGDPSAPAQVAALRRIAAAAPTGGREPFRLRPLPGRIALDALTPSAERGTPLWTVLGVGGDDAAPVGLDLDADGPGVLVAGPPGSGRSTVLRTAAVQHLRRGTAVAVVATHRSPLADLPGRFGPDEGDALRAAVVATPALVVVDDADQLLDTDVDAVLGELLTRPGCGVLAAGGTAELHATYRGFTVPLRRSRSGVLLCPGGAHDGELLGTPVTRGLASRPGRGVLVRRGRSTPIQVALVGEPAWS
jgi:S-DNA-T family DNA segregation ATPase FtsK/SpoIIIE